MSPLPGTSSRAEVGTQIGHAPLAKMVQSLAQSIAQSQFDLNHNNALLARRFASPNSDTSGDDGEGFAIDVDGQPRSLMELGFAPTCYSITSAVFEIKMSISMATEVSRPNLPTKVGVSGSAIPTRGLFSSGIKANVSFMAASSASKYQYKSEASSFIRTRLVTVPTPYVLQERLDALRTKKS